VPGSLLSRARPRGRLAVGAIAVAVLATACKTGAPPAAPATPRSSTTAIPADTPFADVCSGRAFARQPGDQSRDWLAAQNQLQFAVDHAPPDIKVDINVVAAPLIAYFRLLVTSGGDFVKASRDPQYRSIFDRFTQDDYQQASKRLDAWFSA